MHTSVAMTDSERAVVHVKLMYLKHPRELAFSVRYMRRSFLLIPQRTDDISKGKETCVDIDALLEPDTHIASTLRSLRPGQVNKMKLGPDNLRRHTLLHRDSEDAVRSGALIVHEGASDCSAERAIL